MQSRILTIDEDKVLGALDELVCDILPEEVATWQLDGPETFRDMLTVGVGSATEKRLEHVPRALPSVDVDDTLKWGSLLIGCVKSILEIRKLLRERSKTRKDDLELREQVNKLVGNQLDEAGVKGPELTHATAVLTNGIMGAIH